MSSPLLQEIKETDAKERSSLTPLQIKTITSAHFSPKCDPPKADTAPFRPQAALSICCDWPSPSNPAAILPFLPLLLEEGVRCAVPSAPRVQTGFRGFGVLVLGSLQSAVSQSPRKPMISPHCPLRPAIEGSSRWGAMPHTDTDSAGAQWMVAGYPCAPINGPLTPPSIRFRSTQLGEP